MVNYRDVESALWERERRFWTGGEEYYRRNLASEVLMVFPDLVLDRDGTIEAIAAAPRWMSVTFEQQRFVPLSDDAAAIHYRALARREDEPLPYQALATSVYVRRDGEWLLAIHQQTPGEGSAAIDV
jgi:hypothetical protein